MVSLEKGKRWGKGMEDYYGLSLIDLLCQRRAVNNGINKIERKGGKNVAVT